MNYGAIDPQWPMWCCGMLRCIDPRFDAPTALAERVEDIVNNLVDPASSHMLVSEIKPCMSKYIPPNGETANGSLNQLWFLRSYILHG